MKILIVDDEPTILEGIASLILSIPLVGEEIEFCHTVSDSMAALDFLSSHAVDIVLTDIKMPGLDGLGLTESIRYRHPEIKVVILSGFGDINYFQTALRLGAVDYLLKPVKFDELSATISRIVHNNQNDRKFNRSINFQQFLEHESTYKIVIVVDLDEIDTQRATKIGNDQMVSWLFYKVLSETADEMKPIFTLNDNTKLVSLNTTIGICADTPADALERAENFCNVVSVFWNTNIKLPISFGISTSFNGEKNAEIIYNQACSALFARVFKGNGIHKYDLLWHEKTDGKISTELLKAAIELMDIEKILDEVKLLTEYCLGLKDVPRITKGIEKLIFFLYLHLQNDTQENDLLSIQEASHLIKKALWVRHSSNLAQLILEWVNQILELVSPDKKEGSILNRAKKYINDNYNKPMNLADVAKAAYVSPNHLSRLFREKVGITFLEFLTERRIEEAKRLLAGPPIKILDVAETVGYSDGKHFSRIFKELTGYNPSDYKR